MSTRLLIGLDGRAGGRDALELARVLLAGVEDPAALAVSVLYFGPLPMEYALLPEEEAEEAGPLFDEARAALPGVQLETRAYGGASPAAILSGILESEDFDGVVVGSPHRGPVGRVLIGSVAAGLLSGARAPVAVAPHGYADERHEPPRTVAVAYDGGPEAKLALKRAEEIAGRVNGIVRLLTVATPPVVIPVTGAYIPPYEPDPGKVLNEGTKLVDPRLAVEGEQLSGDPARAIAEASGDADMLVVGSRGYGPVARTMLGSVSRKLATHAPCPVLVVPRS
ncbi:MAG: universal stress protein [Solirubrobacterales bacterium]